jgi:putative membrane protein
MKTKSLIGLVVGLAAICALVAWQGVETVVGLLAEAGWGVLLVCLFAVPDQLLSAEAWRRLFPGERRPPVRQAVLASWMGSAVNTLLPVASIGGEVIKARVLTLWSHAGADTVSATIVDKTAQAIVVLVSALVGIALLATVSPDRGVVVGALVGAALLAVGIGGFIAVQVRGSFSFLARGAAWVGAADRWAGLVDGADRLDDAIRAIYSRPGAVSLACALRLTARIVLVGEVILAGHLMGYPIGLAEAVLIKGLIVGLRGVSFAVPGAYGIQEGGFVAIGVIIGLPADLMLAVSLATRVREIVPSIPFLLAWQHTEGRALWRRSVATGKEGT